MGSLDRINRNLMASDIRAIRREMTDPGVHQREAQARRDKAAARETAKAAKKAQDRHDLVVMPARDLRNRQMFVWSMAGIIALVLTVTSPFGFLFAIGVLASVWHHQRTLTADRAAHASAQQRVADEAAAAAARQYLTADDQEWLRRQDG